jgi:hypothetical protein
VIAVLCAIALGVIAVSQTMCLRRAQSRTEALRLALEERKQKYIALGLAMEQAHIACLKGDGAALHEAIRKANRVMAGVEHG